MSELNNDTNVVETTQTEAPFRAFATQKEFDDFAAHLLKKGEEKALKNAKINDGEAVFDKKAYEAKYRKDLEAQIRADIERQAQMTEAEKLADERAKMEESFRQERIEINKEKARNLLSKAGFEEEDMDIYLEFITEDRDVSLGRIQRVCESRKASRDKMREEVRTEFKLNNPNISIGSKQNITLEQAKNMSVKEMTELKRSNPDLYQQLFKK